MPERDPDQDLLLLEKSRMTEVTRLLLSSFESSLSVDDYGCRRVCPQVRPDLGPSELKMDKRMDAMVWENIPEDCLFSVLALLPWWKNLQCRCVCKSWNEELSNLSFLANSSPDPCSKAPCIIFNTCPCAFINFKTRKFNEFHLSSLPPHSYAEYKIVAASAGLFLLDCYSWSASRAMFLVNPLNKTRKKVPGFEWEGLSYPVTMSVNEQTHNVRIVCIDWDPIPDVDGIRLFMWNVNVYDMFRDSWELLSKSVQQGSPFQMIENAVFVGDDLYFLWNECFGHFLIDSVDQFVMKVTPTELVKVPTGSINYLERSRIFEHQGFLMVMNAPDVIPPQVEIWKLDHVSQAWEKVVSMPDHIQAKLYAKVPKEKESHLNVNFDAEGDFVCFSVRSGYNNVEKAFMVYNLVQGIWWEVCCSDFTWKSFWQKIFLWEPHLDMVLPNNCHDSDIVLLNSK